MNQAALIRKSYIANGKEGKVLAANAHSLISILLEELLQLLDEICMIKSRGTGESTVDQEVMAQSILDSLLVSLDMEKGGELALNLRSIYKHVREIISKYDPGNAVRNTRAAHQIMSEIASAWDQIR